jgi:glucose/arabinose dehydrogenase
MKDEQDLLNQLKNLPNQAQAPDRWQQIQQQIDTEQVETKPKASKSKPWWTMAVAASALLVAAITPIFMEDESHRVTATQTAETGKTLHEKTETNQTYKLTIDSLQQANAYYYAKLGNKVSQQKAQLSPKTWSSLSSLRQAQQQYRAALAAKPNNARIQERLFWLYQKERDLLRQFVV